MPNTDSKPISDKEQPQAPQISPHTNTYSRQIEDESIDLYELWINLWNKKWLVILVTIIAALASVLFALSKPPIYLVQALLLPPKAHDIQSLNVQGVMGITPENVFIAFQNNLKSRRLQKKFIENGKHGIMEILSPGRTLETWDIETLQSFSGMIESDRKVGKGIAVSMESGDPDFAAELINNYISFFDKETIREQAADLRNSITNQIQNIEYGINSKREMEKVRLLDRISDIENTIKSKRAKEKKQRRDQIETIKNTIKSKREIEKKRREDRIKLLEEAAIIATKLGFRDRVDVTYYVVQNSELGSVNANSIPLYYRGFRELNAEMDFLKKRKSDDHLIIDLRNLQEKLSQLHTKNSDDPYIYGLRDLQVKLESVRSIRSDDASILGLRLLQEKLTLLRSIKIEEEDMHAVKVDQAAYAPKSPIKPNRRLITLIGTSAGLFFGVFLALFVSFIQRQKEIHSA